MGESVERLLTEASADRAPSLSAHARPLPEISAPELSPVVPAHNEAENLFPLIDEIRPANLPPAAGRRRERRQAAGDRGPPP